MLSGPKKEKEQHYQDEHDGRNKEGEQNGNTDKDVLAEAQEHIEETGGRECGNEACCCFGCMAHRR